MAVGVGLAVVGLVIASGAALRSCHAGLLLAWVMRTQTGVGVAAAVVAGHLGRARQTTGVVVGTGSGAVVAAPGATTVAVVDMGTGITTLRGCMMGRRVVLVPAVVVVACRGVRRRLLCGRR